MTHTIESSPRPAAAIVRATDDGICQHSDEISLTVRHRRLARRRAEPSALRPEARM